MKQINKNSIFFSITIFFVGLMIVAHLIIYVGYTITKQEQIDLKVNRYMKTLFMIHKSQEKGKHHNSNARQRPPHPPKPMFGLTPKQLNDELKEYDLELQLSLYQQIKQKGDLIASQFDWELYEYEQHNYFYRKNRFDTLFIKDNIKVSNKTKYLLGLAFLLNILFISFYIFLIKRLTPLKKLKTNILKFSKGDLNINTSCTGKDEISEVSNEFNNAIKEINELTESRNLFLRNIMHELKTPITKGSLVSDMMVDGKYKESLKRAFSRLEYLLHEFAKIEQLTSKNIVLKKDKYRIVDIVDQAIDILMIEREELQFDINTNLVVDVDFQFFALSLKNLIDNGLKYGDTIVTIQVDTNYLAVKTTGKKLPKKLEEYLRPFNRAYETSTQSLGLGLYIVHNILKAHNLSLQYKYKDNQNIFYIEF